MAFLCGARTFLEMDVNLLLSLMTLKLLSNSPPSYNAVTTNSDDSNSSNKHVNVAYCGPFICGALTPDLQKWSVPTLIKIPQSNDA